MFSYPTDWELSVYGMVIAIFLVTPIPIHPTPRPQLKINLFPVVQVHTQAN